MSSCCVYTIRYPTRCRRGIISRRRLLSSAASAAEAALALAGTTTTGNAVYAMVLGLIPRVRHRGTVSLIFGHVGHIFETS